MYVDVRKDTFACFNKVRKSPDTNFRVGDAALDVVGNITYFGVIIACRGFLSLAAKSLKLKATKVLSKISISLSSEKSSNFKVNLQLFDFLDKTNHLWSTGIMGDRTQ